MTASDQITAYVDKLGDWRGKTVARLRAVIRAASPPPRRAKSQCPCPSGRSACADT